MKPPIEDRPTVLVSACLVGLPCRYDGLCSKNDVYSKFSNICRFIPFCPEIYGGLPTPRVPAEILNGRVITSDCRDVTDYFINGANSALNLARKFGCTIALLKAKSPSCGSGLIYDGSHTGKLTIGDGITASLLKENGILVFNEYEIDEFTKAVRLFTVNSK